MRRSGRPVIGWCLLAGVVVALGSTACVPHDEGAVDEPPGSSTGSTPPTSRPSIEEEYETRWHEILLCTAALGRRSDEIVLVFEPSARGQVLAVKHDLDADPGLEEVDWITPPQAIEELRLRAGDPADHLVLVPEQVPQTLIYRTVSGDARSLSSLARVGTMAGVQQLLPGDPPACSPRDPEIAAAQRRWLQNRYGDGNAAVYLEPGEPDAVPRVRDALLALPSVHSIEYVAQERTVIQLRCELRDVPEAGDVDAISAGAAPPLFRITVDREHLLLELARIEAMPGVRRTTRREDDLAVTVEEALGMIPERARDCPLPGERVR